MKEMCLLVVVTFQMENGRDIGPGRKIGLGSDGRISSDSPLAAMFPGGALVVLRGEKTVA
jgi:hypothetical protein